MRHGYFVTGTDTGIGKTHVCLTLLQALAARGLSTVAMKPIASGCQATDLGLRNDDALQLQQAATIALAYEQVNPYALAEAIAPHLAALACGIHIDLESLLLQFNHIAAQADVVIVEGVGGWLVPLSEQHTIADLAAGMALPVILVVGIRLGCINHALLTTSVMRDRNDCPPLAGWVANVIDPDMAAIDENIATLQQYIEAPLLGTLPWNKQTQSQQTSNEETRTADRQTGFLDMDQLLMN